MSRVVSRVVDGDKGEEDPVVEMVEGRMVFLLCFGAETAPEIGFKGGTGRWRSHKRFWDHVLVVVWRSVLTMIWALVLVVGGHG